MLYWNERWKAGGVLATVVLLCGLCGNGSAEPISPRALVEVVDFGPPVISADGRNVAFRVEQASIERNGYDSVWYVQAMDGSSPPRRVADGGTPLRDSAGNVLATPPVWSADGAWIYYRASMQGRIDVWRAAADGSRSQALTNDPADVRSFWLQADTPLLHYSVGGTRQQVRSAEQDEYDQGVSIDRYVPLGQGLVRSGMIEGRPATQRFSGRWFQRVPLLAGVADQWKTLDLMTMQRRDAATAKVASGAAGTEAGRRSSSGQVIASARDPSRDWLAVIERVGGATSALAGTRLRVWMGAKAKRAIECPAEACHGKSIISLALRPHSDELLFATSDPLRGHAHSLYRWNVRSAQVTHLASSRGHMANGSRYAPGFCAVSASALACVVAEADRPPRLEQIDIESGQRRILFDPNAGLAQQIAKTAPAQLLRWKDAEGTALNGWYFEAAGAHAAPAPLFISYYACQGFLRGGVGDEWPLASLASNGIAALCINQAENEDSDAAKRYEQGAAAVASAIDLLSGEGKADGHRIGMGGLSFGSEVTLWTAAHTRLLAAASVSSPTISPLYYLLASFKGDDFTNELNATWQLRGMDDTPDRWKVISPTFHLDTISAPILFQASEQEYLHSLDYAIPLMQRRRLDLYVFPDEPHIKFQPRHKLAVYERNIDWFRFWLQGIEDPAPGKEGQYAKWRQMPSANGGR